MCLIAHCGVRNSITNSVKRQTHPFDLYSTTFKYGGKEYVDTLKGRLGFLQSPDGLTLCLKNGKSDIERFYDVHLEGENERSTNSTPKEKFLHNHYESVAFHNFEISAKLIKRELDKDFKLEVHGGQQIDPHTDLMHITAEKLNSNSQELTQIKMAIDVPLLRSAENDAFLFKDEYLTAKWVKEGYFRKRYATYLKVQEQKKIETEKTAQRNQPNEEVKEEARPKLSNLSTCVELDQSSYYISGSQYLLSVYYDLKYAEIVFNYGELESQYESVTLKELGVESKDLDEMRATIKPKLLKVLIKHESQIMSKEQLYKMFGGQGKYEAKMREKQEEEDRKQVLPRRAIESPEDRVSKSFKDIKVFLKRLRGYISTVRLLRIKRLISKTSTDKYKLIHKFFYVDEQYSYTISICFNSEDYTFDLRASCWENSKYLEGRIGLNKFFKLMKITQIPKFNSRISSRKLRESFSKEFKELSSKIVVDQKLKKLSILYIQNDPLLSHLSKKGSVSNKELELEYNMFPIDFQFVNEKSYIQKKEMGIKKEIEHRKKFNSEDEMLYYYSAVIQKRWKAVLYTRLLKMAMVRSNKPVLLLIVSHSISEGFFRKSSFHFDRLHNYILILHSIERDGEKTQLKSEVSLSFCLQKDYPDSWQEIETTGDSFYNSTLPLLCKILADSLDFKYNNESGYSCSIRDSNPPQQIAINGKGPQTQQVVIEESKSQIKLIDEVQLLKSTLFMQRTWRMTLKRLNTKRMNQKEAQEAGRRMVYGSLKLITYKKVDLDFYRISLYEKEDEGKTSLKFFIQNVDRRVKLNQEITYSMDENKLLNSKGKPIVQFLIDSLKKGEGNKFYFDLPKNPNFRTVTQRKTIAMEGLDTDPSVTNRVKMSVMRNIVIDDKIGFQKSKIKNQLVEYNIYYDKFGLPMKRMEANENYFRIEVDTDALKRAEPDLPNFKKKDDLRSMMNEISNCLVFTDQQELQIDENKMNMDAIRVKESKLMHMTETSNVENENNKAKIRELEKILLRNPASVSVILKTTKIFDKTHFLMIISKQEKLVGGSSQASIANYEEYIVTYMVELKDLSNSTTEVLKLEFTDRQCKEWFRLKDEKQVPVFFVNNLNMFNHKIVLPIYKKVNPSELLSYEVKGTAFYYIKGLELIRRYIMNRKFNVAFKQYKLERSTLEAQTHAYNVINIDNNWYHAIVYSELEDRTLVAKLWNVKNYYHFKISIGPETVKTYKNFIPELAEVLLQSLYIVSNQRGVMELKLNSKNLYPKVKALSKKKTDKVQKKYEELIPQNLIN